MGSKQDYLFLLAGQYSCREFFFYWLYFAAISAADCCFFSFIYLLMFFFSSCLSTQPWWKRAFAVRAAKLGLHTFSTAALQLLHVCAVFVCLHMPLPPPPFYARRLWEWCKRPSRCAFHLAVKRGHPGLSFCIIRVSRCLRVISVVVPPPHPPSLPAYPVNQTLPLRPPQAWARRTTPSWCRSGSSWFRRKTPWSAMSQNSWFCKYDAKNTSEWEEMWGKKRSIYNTSVQ